MTYITDELRGIDTAISDLRARIEKLEREVAELRQAAPKKYIPPSQEEIVAAEYSANRFVPTGAQLSYARDIARALGHDIDFSKLSRVDVSEYIDRHKAEYYRRRNEKEKPRQGAPAPAPSEGVMP
jgi:cell division septum initiation protein DivIVA